MKFKLIKSQHYKYFNLLKYLEKSGLSLKENKSNDNLVFSCVDGMLHISSNSLFANAYFNLNLEVEFDKAISVDMNLFNNAFSNFPADEINFAYIEDNNSLILGNKKTKIVLKTSLLDNYSLEILDSKDTKTFNSKFNDGLKSTSFSCSSSIEDYPYSSILFFEESDKFNFISSDKHRLSIYGDKFIDQKSFLIGKNTAELIVNFNKDLNCKKYSITKNKLNLFYEHGMLSCKLDNNDSETVFQKFNSFFEKSHMVCKFIVNKETLTKSLKLISSITNSEKIDLKLSDNIILLSGSSSDKGIVADKIQVTDDLIDLNLSYYANHILKVLDVLYQENIEFKVMDYNGYNLLSVQTNNFKHLIFPME